MIYKDFKPILKSAMNKLPRLEGEVLTRSFGLIDDNPQHTNVIAEDLDLSRQRIQQLRASGLRRLGRMPGFKKYASEYLTNIT